MMVQYKIVSLLLLVSCVDVIRALKCTLCPNKGQMTIPGASLPAGLFSFYPNTTTCFGAEIMLQSEQFNSTECDEVIMTNASQICACTAGDVATVSGRVQIQLLNVSGKMTADAISVYNGILTEYYSGLLSPQDVSNVTAEMINQTAVNASSKPLDTLIDVFGIVPNGSALTSELLQAQMVSITNSSKSTLLSALSSTSASTGITYFNNVTKIYIFNSSYYPAPAPPAPAPKPVSTVIKGPSKGAVAGIMIGTFAALAAATAICAQTQMKKQEERLAERAATRQALDKLEEDLNGENGEKEDNDDDHTGVIEA